MKNTSFKQNNFETIKCDSPSHNSVYCNDQASSLRSFVFAWLWLRRAKGSYDSMLSEPAGSVKAMLECSPVCGMDVSRPNFAEVCYGDVLEYHRVRSLRDITPKCLRHIEVPSPASECNGVGAYDKVVEIYSVNRE